MTHSSQTIVRRRSSAHDALDRAIESYVTTTLLPDERAPFLARIDRIRAAAVRYDRLFEMYANAHKSH